jgi:hypothetical protein
MRLRFITGILIMLIGQMLTGQELAVGNPFEISSRLPKTAVAGVPAGPQNPFDVVAHRAPGVEKNIAGNRVATPDKAGRMFSFPQGNTLTKAFVFIVLILILSFFTFAATANRSALLKAWRSFLSSNGLTVAQREAHGFSGNTPYFLLYLNFLLNAGVFVFLIIQAFNPDHRYNNLSVFTLSMVLTAIVLLLKHVLLYVFAWLMPGLSKDINSYNFLIIIFSCVLGFFLIPFNFLIAFAGTIEWQTFVTLWLLALSAIFVAYGLLRAFSLGTKYLFGYPLHFLLYLCTAEIIPVLLIAKLLFY